MNRHKPLETVSVEMQKALKLYAHSDLSRQVTDAAAIDVLGALRDGLRVTALHQLESLAPGCVIRAANKLIYEKRDDGQWNWYTPGSATPFPAHMRQCLLDAHLIWNPAWVAK